MLEEIRLTTSPGTGYAYLLDIRLSSDIRVIDHRCIELVEYLSLSDSALWEVHLKYVMHVCAPWARALRIAN